MWLEFGVNPGGELVAIEAVRRGRTELRCPYCQGELTAKKGQIKAHHFAHTGETCYQVADANREIPILPLYDKFNLRLSPKEFEALQTMWRTGDCHPDLRYRLEQQGLIKWNPYKGRRGGYEFTHLGKIPMGALSLMLFNQVQEPMILERLAKLERQADQARGFTEPAPDLDDRLVDLKLYRAQLKRILSQTLYYLEVQADGQTFYKIGTTTRLIAERVAEIQTELHSHSRIVAIKVLGTWNYRGNVELYFKYRYQSYNHRIGTLTEYYKFDDPDEAKAALRDLRRMKPKVLTPEEMDILAGKPSSVEQAILTEQKAQQRSQVIKTGMERARQWGTHVGRPPGATEADETFLAKPASQRVIQALQEGLSVRKAAERAGVSPNTVQKVKTIWSTRS